MVTKLLPYYTIIFLLLSSKTFLFAQCPTSDFSVTSTACLNESLSFTNSSTNATSYFWDFCIGDFNEDPTTTSISQDDMSGATGFDLIQDGNNWHGYAVDKTNELIFRFDYGTDPNNDPSIEELTISEGTFTHTPEDISMINFDGEWYGVVSYTSAGGDLIRLDFGSDPTTNEPTVVNLGSFGITNEIRKTKLFEEDGSLLLMLSNHDAKEIWVVDYGNSFDNVIDEENDIYKSTTATSMNNINGFDIQLVNGNYIVHANARNGSTNMVRYNYGNSLLNSPTIDAYYSLTSSGSRFHIELVKDGEDYYGVVSRNNGAIYVYNFGDLTTAITPTAITYSSTLSTIQGLRLIRDNSSYLVLGAQGADHIKTVFDFDCGASIMYSTEEVPQVSYETDGSFEINLIASKDGCEDDNAIESVTISTNTAPNISFTVDTNRCIDNTNSFTSEDDGDIASYSWDFNGDDTENSTLPNPTYDFSIDGTGTYTVTLDVISNDGCSNNSSMEISIYNAPSTPDFETAVGALCSNADVAFNNLTDETGLEAVITYSWDFDGESTSAEKDPTYSFSTSGTKDIGLIAMIPGCTTAVHTEQAVIEEGPVSDFTYTNNCFGEAIEFTDLSTGDITEHSWDFDDLSAPSTDTDPTHTYASTGDYDVTLTVTNTSGCATPSTQSITVSDDPKASFAYDEAIENVPIQFSAEDLTLSDDAINSWDWDFDGLGSSTEQNPIFTFDTPASYDISLSVSTTQGCDETIELAIEVLEATAPTSNFEVNSEACLNEELFLKNYTVNATSYFWDFCTGDFNQDPIITSTEQETMTGASGYEVIQSEDNWYGYAVDKLNKTVFRFDYGTDPYSDPAIIELIIPDGTFTESPEDISMIFFENEWYGVISYDSPGGDLIRLDFGSDPTNNEPSIVNLGNFGISNEVRKVKLFEEDGNLLLMLSNHDAKEIWVVDYGNSFDNVIDEENDIYKSTTATSMNNINGFDIQLIEGNYIVHAVARNGTTNMVRYNYGSSLLNTPTIEAYYDLASSGSQFHIELILDGGVYYGAVSRNNAAILVYNFGDLTTANTPIEISYSTTLSAMQGFDIIKDNSTYLVLGAHGSSSVKTVFDFDCGASTIYSTETNPNIQYTSAGTFGIELIASNDDSVTDQITNSVTVSSETAPEISFTSENNECITESNEFITMDDGGLTYAWDFDNDGITDSTDPSPEHTLGSVGDHQVSLTVHDGICSNFVQETISIYPVPDTPTFFTSGSPYCTGADISFTNLFDESVYNGATLTYVWNYNDEGSSTDRNGIFNFDTDGSKTVTLSAIIPGCTTSSDDTELNLIVGPVVDFTYENKCLGEDTEFINNSTGDNITSQYWNFGDLGSSTDNSPTHTYSSTGGYNVTLTVSNSSGCNNVLTQLLTIDDKPVADFNMGVGCEGQEIGFEDQSTVNDANIESYSWNFNEEGNSTEKDPFYTFESQGTYEVTLAIESTYGCVDEITQNVSVQVAPTVDFDIDLGCLDATTQFLDQSESESENPINTWYWDINGDIKPNTQNPSQVFSVPGVYSATLTVTPNNLCVSSISKEFTIHELPIADFTTDKNCDNENTIFNDASTSATTSIVDYHWQFDEEGTGSNNPETHNFEQAGNYNISLTITDEVGCESNAQQTITIHSSPIAAFDVNRDIGPAPLDIEFFNQSIESESYLWSFDDADNSTSTATNPQFIYQDLGEYEAKLISRNEFGCSDTTMLPITVAEPIKDLELVQITKEESEGKTNIFLTVRNNGNVAIRNFDIRIDLDNNSSVYETYAGTLFKNESVTFPLNFTFSAENNNIGYSCVTLTDSEEEYEDINLINNEGCIDFNQKVVVENSYPNPVSSNDAQIRLNMILPSKAPVQIFLMDATGAILYQDIYSDTVSGLNSFFIDIYSYRKGMYFIKVIYDQTESTQRFVKI
ncbi:MAG: PKD domain-containing protein [Reichenbachiella sp.]|uniref:PKD domain-containing protein n=1 Tax=Reichenbachiella sp. TaxID=2184521 RepID=UPI0032982375